MVEEKSNVLISFLGTTNYIPVNYYLYNKKNKVDNTRFVQEAISKILCKDWTDSDRIVVFLTDDAKKKNWENREDHEKQKIIGLYEKLQNLKLKPQIVPISIPSGKNKDEIWKIFDIVFKTLNENDHVHFDITHAFRMIPMLVFIILNYAKTIKNISIDGIYYGAMESLGTISDIRAMDISQRDVPIFDVTEFVRVFEWTIAVNNFQIYGDAKEIYSLTMDIAKNSRNNPNVNIDVIRNFANKLKYFTDAIRRSLGPVIIEFEYETLKHLIKKIKNNNIYALNPLLDRISNKINDFKSNDVENGYRAVKWCIEHNLIQQGYTILRETIISEILLKALAKSYFKNEKIFENEKIREGIAERLSVIALKNRHDKKENMDGILPDDIRQKVDAEINECIAQIFYNLGNYRNYINHAGFKHNHIKANELSKQLSNFIKQLEECRKNE